MNTTLKKNKLPRMNIDLDSKLGLTPSRSIPMMLCYKTMEV